MTCYSFAYFISRELSLVLVSPSYPEVPDMGQSNSIVFLDIIVKRRNVIR